MAYYKKYNNPSVGRYKKRHYHPVHVLFSIDYYENELKPLCDKLGISVGTFVKQATQNELERIKK